MSDIRINPASHLRGKVGVPGDKSISHRLAMLASIADGESTLRNYSTSADCHSTLRCLQALGVPISCRNEIEVRIEGLGLKGLRPPDALLDAGNSGSTLRMLTGLLAGHSFTSTITGDASLQDRPMGRILQPLTQMGARFEARDQEFPPVTIHGNELVGIAYPLPVASAQVKTSVLFAGLLGKGRTEVTERIPTRNHTEIALRQFGSSVHFDGQAISVYGGTRLNARDFEIPGDLSSAAFFAAAATLVPGSEITLSRIGLNPTRTQFFNLLSSMGGDWESHSVIERQGEVRGDIFVRSSVLEGASIRAEDVAGLIDEIPILAVLGARSRSGLSVHGARELRIKESDRIHSIVENLRSMGAQIREFDDGFEVEGMQVLHGADLESFGDHRIAMAFSIAALLADSPSVIHDADCVGISFPDFYQVLQSIEK